jgi:putative molybdopterin biosynthesis protein
MFMEQEFPPRCTKFLRKVVNAGGRLNETSGLRNQLRVVRTRLGLSQQELADAAGIARQTIGGIEAERYSPSAAVALRLARALGCRVEELFWLAEDGTDVEATAAADPGEATPVRVAMARLGGRWVAHPLRGASAFRTEMVPADGLATPIDRAGALHGDGQRPHAGTRPARRDRPAMPVEQPGSQGNREGVLSQQGSPATPAGGAGTLRVRLLDDAELLARTVVLAGCAPVLSLWARSAERWYPGLRVHWTHANSAAALRSMAACTVHAAGLHLWDAASGEFNAPFVRRAVHGRSVALVSLGTWEEGLIVRPGNPKRLLRVADLAQEGVRLINREEGAGSRLLLDSALGAERVAPEAVAGYGWCAATHQEVAEAVASGGADAGVGTAAVAAIYGLGFVPLQMVRYDLAILEEVMAEEPVRQLIGTLEHRWVRSQLQVLGGYDTTTTGETRTIVC